MRTRLNILISTIFQNGGEATRALEIAKIIRAYQPTDYEIEITFLSHFGPFDYLALEQGFKVYHIEPKSLYANFHDDFKTRFGDLIGDVNVAQQYLKNEIDAYYILQPDILIHGFWPIAGIARRMVNPNLNSIAFLPLPLTEKFLSEIKTFPDALMISRLPEFIQNWIIRLFPAKLMRNNPALKHQTIAKAAYSLGWIKAKPLANIFDMIRANHYLINDFPFFYKFKEYGEKFTFTGPLYAQTISKPNTDVEILKWMSADNKRKKIFCSLGTSGNKIHLLELIKVFNMHEGLDWSAVILAPPAICDIAEAREVLQNDQVYITENFVNAVEINTHADVVICHGGQGTLQTAIISGTPLVGLATQPEQQINLEHLEHFGMAKRISPRNWKAAHIRNKVLEILYNDKYKQRAYELKQRRTEVESLDLTGNKIWEILKQIKHS